MPGVAPAARAQLEALAQRAGLPAPLVHEGAPSAFRYRARLAVRGRALQPKIGIFQLGTHRVVHIPNCPIHHPLINEVSEQVRQALVAHRLPLYSDSAHAGRVRYLQIVVQRQSGSAQLVIVTNDAAYTGLEPFFSDLSARLGSRLHSAFWNGQPERSNSVLGSAWHHVAGPPALEELFAETRLFYPPGAFGQSHLELAERIAARVAQHVPSAANVVEFYAGVGALGLPLAARGASLTLNEIGADSLTGLAMGIEALPAEVRARVQVQPGAAGEASHLLANPNIDVVLVDPPRKGLDAPLLAALLQTPARRLVYVSCGLDALSREAATLLDGGAYALTALEAFALFPYTEHVETLAVFDRKR
jgi:tRNA/tmRNA/rRNA uracil-C5-methylase (TrmA/RlmC/RlmD family)